MRDYKTLYSELKSVSQDSGLSIAAIIKDFYGLKKKKGLIWEEYYNFQLEKQPKKFINSFLGINEQRYYLDYLNPKKYYTVARNKYFTHLFLDAAGIKNKARLICYYLPEFGITTSDIGNDYISVERILKSKNVSSCVIKTTESSHGDNVYVISSISFKEDDCTLIGFDGREIKLRDILANNPLIFEETIKQTDQLANFNKSSVNTIRFMTLLFPDKSVKIIATFIKIGRNGRCVDNAGGGGNVDAGIEVETGTLYNSIQFDGWRKVKKIEVHPDSGNRIEGVTINNWDNIKEKVIQFQQAMPYIKAAGWDIAITDQGPYIIEVNDFWDTTGQLFIGSGWREDIRNCYFEWKKTNEKRHISYQFERKMNLLTIDKLCNIVNNG